MLPRIYQNLKGENMNNTINAVSFKGNMARAYLQKKAAEQAKVAAEKTKEAARLLINNNQKASKARQYVGTGAYFGNVPTIQRSIGTDKALESIAASKALVPNFISKSTETVEPNFHFFG